MKLMMILGTGYVLIAGKELPKIGRLLGVSVGRSVALMNNVRAWVFDTANAAAKQNNDAGVDDLKKQLNTFGDIRRSISGGGIASRLYAGGGDATPPSNATPGGPIRQMPSQGRRGNELRDLSRKLHKKD